MKRAIIIIVAVVIVAAIVFVGYQQFLAPVAPTPTPVPVDFSPQTSQVVSAEAYVQPRQKADLAFKASGRVLEILVVEGDLVQAGQVLASLDKSDQQMLVDQAQVSVRQAEANLEQAAAGVESARASLASAEAQLAKVKAGATQQAVAQAEAAVETAKAQLAQVTAKARPEDIQAASAQLLKVEAVLRQAQSEYDRVSWSGDVSETPQALALEQATLDFKAAQSDYERLVNGPTAEEIAVARSQVKQAEAALAVTEAGPTAEDVAISEAQVAQAREGVAQAEAGQAVAQAGLESAQTNLTQAQERLADYDLAAPFAGTVAEITIDAGQFVSTGVPVISLADTSIWYVKTDDLSEIDIVAVAVGQPVKVTVDALPGETFEGVVTDIRPKSETKRGDITYTVTIKLLDAQDAPLRWGMTSFVDIEVAQ